MLAAVRSEFRKFFTTRMWWGMVLATVVAGAGFALLIGLLFTSDSIRSGPNADGIPRTDLELARSVFTSGIGVGYLLTLAIGIMTIGSEYRHKTISSTFLATPARTTVMGAKVLALLVLGVFYAVLSMVASVAVGTVVLTLRGHHPFADPAIWRTLALGLVVLGLWALIGLGAGILIPNQVASLLISIGAAWILLPIVSGVLTIPDWGRHIWPYFPNEATNAMLGVNGGFGGGGTQAGQLSWWAGGLVLLGYAAVMTVVGSLRTVLSDIT